MRSFAALSLLTAASASSVVASKKTFTRRQYGNYGDDNNYGGGSYGDDDNNGGGGGSTGTLDPNLICTGCQSDGLEEAEEGQAGSITSQDNFINFCGGADGGPTNLPVTNGQQITTGSCNVVPMGMIASTNNMPASKFVSPKNLDTIPSNTDFTIQMAIENLSTGTFTNPDVTYYSAPCQTGDDGNIIGHSHFVIQQVDDLTSTNIKEAADFAFFKGVNTAAENGILSVPVDGGLAAGVYKMGSINACANHQPVLVAVAQHSILDDVVYFTVSDDAGAGGDNGGNYYGQDGQDAVDNASDNYVAGDDAAADDAAAGDNYYGQDDAAADDAAADPYYGQDDAAADDAAADPYYGQDDAAADGGDAYYGQDDAAADDAAQDPYYGQDQAADDAAQDPYYGQDQAADDAAQDPYYGQDQAADDSAYGGDDSGNYDNYGGGNYGGFGGFGQKKRGEEVHQAAKRLLSSPHKRMTRLSKRRLSLENVA